jgi:hypothetical protein
MSETEEFNVLIILVVFCETAIVFLTTILATSLFVAHLFMAAVNLSTIEYMKGRPFKLFWSKDSVIVSVM